MSELLYSSKNAYTTLDESILKAAQEYCEGYKKFLDNCKIERFGVRYAIELAEKEGFEAFEEGKKYKAGDKVYYNQKNRAIIFAVIGTESMEKGFNLTAAHTDCPKLDLKPNPLYEDSEIAYLKTHYYGGVKKYQWVTIPLALCGVVCKKDGTTVDVCIGDCEEDPVLYISDILPHLGRDQMAQTMANGITAEMLNVIVGSAPDKEAESNKTKTAVMKILNEKYGINEEDFFTAELSIVPAMKAKDVGLDRSLIAAFGHDDRICAYPCFTALLEAKDLKKTSLCIFADREEVGSMGVTGMRSAFFADVLRALCESTGANPRIAFKNSACISSDVSAAYDPNFPSVFEKNNSGFINHGFAISKYTGHGGKSGASEASPEMMAKLCAIFDEAGTIYHFAELGKVDAGGGGTVSQFIADKNIEVVDIGIPMLSMHAPYELAAKSDIYLLHIAMKAFYEKY